MKQNTVSVCDLSDLFYWFNRSNLIICKHDRDQKSIRPDGRLKCIQINQSIFIYIQISYIIPSILQILAGMQDSMMLDFCCNDMSPMYSIGFCRTF